MGRGKNKNHTTRFLIYSFVGLIIFSIFSFSFLGLYMTKKAMRLFTK